VFKYESSMTHLTFDCKPALKNNIINSRKRTKNNLLRLSKCNKSSDDLVCLWHEGYLSRDRRMKENPFRWEQSKLLNLATPTCLLHGYI